MAHKLKLAILGYPVSHSRSPILQACFAKNMGITEFSYDRVEATCETLEETVRKLISDGYNGFNCTMPVKGAMAALADTLSDGARAVSSVNTVCVKNGQLHGYTTDGDGLLFAIRRAYGDCMVPYGECLRGKKVVLLGAGAAARSAAFSLVFAGGELTIVNRTLSGAYSLRDTLGTGCECLGFDDMNALCRAASECDILINCTCLGMKGKDEFASLDFIDALGADAIVVDAVYEPLETTLLRRARARGIQTVSGLWMLVYQGALAFEKWTGIIPDEDACAAAFELVK